MICVVFGVIDYIIQSQSERSYNLFTKILGVTLELSLLRLSLEQYRI